MQLVYSIKKGKQAAQIYRRLMVRYARSRFELSLEIINTVNIQVISTLGKDQRRTLFLIRLLVYERVHKVSSLMCLA